MFLVWILRHGCLPPVIDTPLKYSEIPSIFEALCRVGVSVRLH